MVGLKRAPKLKDSDVDLLKERAALAKDASTLLGYSIAAYSQRVGPLAMALHELGVEPLDPAAVRKYKAKMQRKPHSKRRYLYYVAAACALPPGLLLTAGEIWLSTNRVWNWLEIVAILLTVTGVAIGIGAVIHAHDFRARNSWYSLPLKHYDGEVPDFALSRAIEIKKKMPEAIFHIEAMTQDEYRVVRDPDPFMVVSYQDEKYYIDVWDEPQFERKL